MESDIQEKRLSRREFLELSLVGLPFSAVLANAYKLLDTKFNLPPNLKEKKLVVTPDGYRVGFILGNHGAIDEKTGRIDNLGATRIDLQDLFLPVGAFFNDGWINSLDPRVNGNIVEESIRRAISQIPNFYRVPFEYGLSNNVPFIFGDINLKGTTIDQFVDSSDLSKKGISLAMSTLILENIEKALNNYLRVFKYTRRDFLRLLVFGGMGVLSHYYSTPAVTYVSRELGIRPNDEVFKNFQALYSDLIHPSNYAIVMRNIVWALKCRDLFESGIIPKDKVINIVGGLDHRFLDFFIKNPEVAKRYWHLFNYGEVAGLFSQGDKTWVNNSRIFYPSTKQTKIIHHNGLDILVS